MEAPNKVLGLACYLCSIVAVLLALRSDRYAILLALAVLLASPYAIFWALGGLETPILMAFVALFSALVYRARAHRAHARWDVLPACVVAGLAFVTRYDSILYLAPGLLAIMLRCRIRAALACGAAAAAIPLAWLTFAHWYYGDILPTSFYVKARVPIWWKQVNNLAYMFEFYIFSGIALLHVVLGMLVAQGRGRRAVVSGHFAELWWAYVGCLLVLAYGLWTATTHMMYSFRLLVPYLPVLALTLGDLVQRQRGQETEGAPVGGVPVGRAIAATAGLVFMLQAVNFTQIWWNNLSGARNSEFRATHVREMSEFVTMYGRAAGAIEEHWSTQAGRNARQPRLNTFAAGLLPFLLDDVYVYEPLISYRHGFRLTNDELKLCSDYICVLTPFKGSVDEQLPGRARQWVPIFEAKSRLDGRLETYLVFFNKAPQVHILTARVDGEPGGAMPELWARGR